MTSVTYSASRYRMFGDGSMLPCHFRVSAAFSAVHGFGEGYKMLSAVLCEKIDMLSMPRK